MYYIDIFILIQFSSGGFTVAFSVIDMHASKHAKNPLRPNFQLNQSITSFDLTVLLSLKDGRLLLGQCNNNNSDDVFLFCLKWQPRPLYLHR